MRSVNFLFLLSLLLFTLSCSSRPAFNEVNRLAEFGQVWGFLKYYHPGAGSGEVNWDSVLVNAVPRVRDAASLEAYHMEIDGETVNERYRALEAYFPAGTAGQHRRDIARNMLRGNTPDLLLAVNRGGRMLEFTVPLYHPRELEAWRRLGPSVYGAGWTRGWDLWIWSMFLTMPRLRKFSKIWEIPGGRYGETTFRRESGCGSPSDPWGHSRWT